MTTIRATASTASRGAKAASPLTFDALAKLKPAQLERLFAAGKTPDIHGYSGFMPGRFLDAKVAGLDFPTGNLPFPWKGKTLNPPPAGKKQGDGINHYAVVGKQFPFTTYVAPSSTGKGKPVLVFDYTPSIPPVSTLRDQMREIEPGLLLGQGYLELGGKPKFIGWFVMRDPARHD